VPAKARLANTSVQLQHWQEPGVLRMLQALTMLAALTARIMMRLATQQARQAHAAGNAVASGAAGHELPQEAGKVRSSSKQR